jgi:hypothetical protein
MNYRASRSLVLLLWLTGSVFAGCTTPVRLDGGTGDGGMDAPRFDGGQIDGSLLDGACGTCDDGNPCTRDVCLPDAGCAFMADDTLPYDDGEACTRGDRCSGGVALSGAPMECDDGIACTVDACLDGTCSATPMDALCTAAAGGTCEPTGCQYGSCNATTCMPASTCETATCAGDTCLREVLCPPGAVCCGGDCCVDDTNPCTTTVCVGGACMQVANTAACSDGNACTTGDVCALGVCMPGPSVDCNDGNPCTVDTCSAGTGSCLHASRTNGYACGRSLPATCSEEVCLSGNCVGRSTCGTGQVCCGDGTCASPGLCAAPM